MEKRACSDQKKHYYHILIFRMIFEEYDVAFAVAYTEIFSFTHKKGEKTILGMS